MNLTRQAPAPSPREARALDAGRAAVIVTAPVLARIFEMERAELRRYVAVRYRTHADNDLANFYRFYAWSILGGLCGLLAIVASFVAKAAHSAADGRVASVVFALFLAAAVCAVLSALRSALAGRLATLPSGEPEKGARRSRDRRAPAKRINSAQREVTSPFMRLLVEPSNVDFVFVLIIAVSYLAGGGSS